MKVELLGNQVRIHAQCLSENAYFDTIRDGCPRNPFVNIDGFWSLVFAVNEIAEFVSFLLRVPVADWESFNNLRIGLLRLLREPYPESVIMIAILF